MSDIDLIVRVRINSEDSREGVLSVNENAVIITLDSGEIISSHNSNNITYSIVNNPRLSESIVFFKPEFMINHFYVRDFGHSVEDIFPPSSGGFYGRLRAGKEKAIYIVQRTVNDSRLMLIIGHPRSGTVFETQLIQPYEAETLRLKDNEEVLESWRENIWSDKRQALSKEFLQILDEPSPSWKELSRLLTGITIPDLQLGVTVRDTLSQLVPSSFPDSIRNQLMAFLAFVVKDKIQVRDLIEPLSKIDVMPMFGSLVQGHFRCITDNTEWPQYLKLIQQSSRGHLEQPKVTLPEFVDREWRYLWGKIEEAFPNWFGSALATARELNEHQSFRPRLPVTKSQAVRSKKMGKERLAAITYGLKIRGHISPHTIGLTELLYIGAAYRWPHRHMRFITRLGLVSENPPHLQVMHLPPSSVERIMRALPQAIKISWSKRMANLDLYNEQIDKWEIPVDKILQSIDERSSKRKITSRFGSSIETDTHQISVIDAKVLGLISGGGIHLESFEEPPFFEYWNLSQKQVSSSLLKLQEKGVLSITHEVDDTRLVSMASFVQGNSKNVTSFVDSLLTNTPTSLVMLNDDFESGVVLSRIPDDVVFSLASKLNQLGLQDDITIRCMRPRSFRTFTFTLYERLLQADGTWNDDVSAFLSQARSKRTELSESNA